MKKNHETTAATRQNLIEAFCILLQKKPVQKITIQAISEKAGYNRSTFYKYFLDVYDIFEQIENIVLSQVKENFRQNISPSNFEQTFLQAFTKIQSENSTYFEVLLNPNNRAHFVQKLILEVSPIFMETFNLPPQNPKSKYLVEIYMQTVLAALIFWIDSKRDLPLDEISKIIGNALTSGVVNLFSKEQI